MATRYSIKDINQLVGREFFFDTNVLMYLFYPASGWQVVAYSKLFSDLLKHKSKLLIDSHVLSELINRILRIEHKNSGTTLDFKQYRNSADGQKSVKQAHSIAKIILKQFIVDGNKLSNTDIEYFLTADSFDFNDKIIEKHCLDNRYILVTNDIDFQLSSAEILTANKNFGIKK